VLGCRRRVRSAVCNRGGWEGYSIHRGKGVGTADLLMQEMIQVDMNKNPRKDLVWGPGHDGFLGDLEQMYVGG